MSYDSYKKESLREHFFVVEIVIGGQTFIFCENRTPVPFNLDAVPCLAGKPTFSPTAVDLKGGLGVRASCSISLNDFMDYSVYGTTTNPVKFWPTWRANYPYYQGAKVSVYSGYIVNDLFNADNFQKREYIIESWGYSNGKASITCKDPLKLADNIRAQAPKAASYQLDADVLAGSSTITLNDTAGLAAFGFLRVNSEIMQIASVDSSTQLTVARGLNNTVAADHTADDAVQLCKYYNDTVSNIVYSLLVDFADIDPSFINKGGWDEEVNLFLPGLYEALITEPTGVQTLLKELGEQAPHYLYWDERSNQIQLSAIKQPPDTALTLTDDENLISGSVSYSDKNDMRVSRVIVHFGQFDPTKKLDEFSNYQQTHVRVDTAAESNYNEQRIKTIYSRWINNSNKAAALRLAARVGRRFSDTPRAIAFSLDPKDSDLWTGDPCIVSTDQILSTSGIVDPMRAQIISVNDKGSKFEYKALEYTYGPSAPGDEDADDTGKTVILSGDITDVNLRSIYNTLFPAPIASDEVRFIFDSACTAGGTSTSYGVRTGSWPELSTPILIDVKGLIVGKGGDGADVGGSADNGGTALYLDDDVRISNAGIIGGGGGGGGWDAELDTAVAGSGGAGFVLSSRGQGTRSNDVITNYPQGGSKTAGGDIGLAFGAVGGKGGDLGQNGTGPNGAGSAGAAIVRNGFTITYTGAGAGDIRGSIL